MKTIRLSVKEIRRASEDGCTIVARRQENGLYMVALVDVATGMPVFKPSFVEKADISEAVKNELRMGDKCGGMGGKMASASRHRFRKYLPCKEAA